MFRINTVKDLRMKMDDITHDSDYLVETKMVWAKTGKKVTRKYRCTFGKRKGRVVADPSQCSKPVDMKKRFTLRRTTAQKGSRMTRKAQRTKRTNPASKMVRALNK
jgi:hypothetical protein